MISYNENTCDDKHDSCSCAASGEHDNKSGTAQNNTNNIEINNSPSGT